MTEIANRSIHALRQTPDMPNIRYIPEGSLTSIWVWLGLPKYETISDSRGRRRELVAPRYDQFYSWWRSMRETGCVPDTKKKFLIAELHLGGYYNQEPDGKIIGTAVCSSRCIERLPLEDGEFIVLPNERSTP